MKFLISVIVLVVAMGLKDVLATAMTVYESRGEGKRAGLSDAGNDIASFLYTVVGVDALNKAGFSLQGIVIVLVVAFTSYNVTMRTTNFLGRRGKAKIAKHGAIVNNR